MPFYKRLARRVGEWIPTVRVEKIVNGHREIRGFCSIFRSDVIGEEKHKVKNGISGRRVSYETGRSIDVNARIIGLKTIRQSLLLFTCRTKGNL